MLKKLKLNDSMKTYMTFYAAKSCLTLCDPIDGSPPGSPVPGIPQARTLEWVAISFSNAWKWKVKVKSLSHVRLLATPWTAAYQAALSMGFSRQEYWSGVPLPSPTGRPGVLQFMGSQRVRHDWAINWTELKDFRQERSCSGVMHLQKQFTVEELEFMFLFFIF